MCWCFVLFLFFFFSIILKKYLFSNRWQSGSVISRTKATILYNSFPTLFIAVLKFWILTHLIVQTVSRWTPLIPLGKENCGTSWHTFKLQTKTSGLNLAVYHGKEATHQVDSNNLCELNRRQENLNRYNIQSRKTECVRKINRRLSKCVLWESWTLVRKLL